MVAFENNALWHERDISHSSAERVILPDSTILLDYMLYKWADTMDNLIVYPERMLQNLWSSYGLVFSQSVLLKLIDKGLSREEAYRVVQTSAMKAWQDRTSFKDLLSQDETVRASLTEAELDSCFDPSRYLQNIGAVFARLEKLEVVTMTPEKLYEGKAKIVYSTDDPNLVSQKFKDDATAFDGKKKGQIAHKGVRNATISTRLFKLLEEQGIITQLVEQTADDTLLCKRLKMFPVEVVVRNYAAGSICKRLGFEEGAQDEEADAGVLPQG